MSTTLASGSTRSAAVPEHPLYPAPLHGIGQLPVLYDPVMHHHLLCLEACCCKELHEALLQHATQATHTRYGESSCGCRSTHNQSVTAWTVAALDPSAASQQFYTSIRRKNTLTSFADTVCCQVHCSDFRRKQTNHYSTQSQPQCPPHRSSSSRCHPRAHRTRGLSAWRPDPPASAAPGRPRHSP